MPDYDVRDSLGNKVGSITDKHAPAPPPSGESRSGYSPAAISFIVVGLIGVLLSVLLPEGSWEQQWER